MSPLGCVLPRRVGCVPRIRGDEPRRGTEVKQARAVFPAYVGMSPDLKIQDGSDNSVPRIRGDEPGPSLATATR